MSCQGHGGREPMAPDNTPKKGVELPRPCPSVCTHHIGGGDGTLEFFTPVPIWNSSGGCTHVISLHCPPRLRSWRRTHLYQQLSQEPRLSQDLSACCRRLFSHHSYSVPDLVAPFLQAGYGRNIVCHKLGPSQPVPRVWPIIGCYGVWTTERPGFQ